MRARILSSLLLFLLAAPLQAQVCNPEVAPDIPMLFPDSVEGLKPQFYRAMSGCVTHMYQGGTPWAVVSIEPNTDIFLGQTAEGLVDHYQRNGTRYVLHEGWPVAMVDQDELGEEFITLRGPVRITVLVKEGDGEESLELAHAFFREIFQRVPCELGTY